jgi:phosphoglycolate phosphatase-like HAD superfamily hydrolase
VNSNKITTIFFDLDGTLVNPFEAIKSSLLCACDQIKRAHPNTETIYKFIRPTIRKSMQDLLKIPREQQDIFLNAYRDHYGREGIFLYHLYPGIENLISESEKKFKAHRCNFQAPCICAKNFRKCQLGKAFLVFMAPN